MPIETFYQARDGANLSYRYFPSHSGVVLIMVHGITEPGMYLHPFAQFLADRGTSSVYVPDLRGYGANPIRRGDIDYIGQLDDDLEDLVAHVKGRHPSAKIIMGGHSAGGATAIRQAVRPVAEQFAAYVLISPALSPTSPLDRKGKDVNSAQIDIPWYVALTLLNAVGIRRWNGRVVYRRTPPPESLHGLESLNLSYRLALFRMVGSNYGEYLKRLRQPAFVLVAGDDEVFVPEAYEPLYGKYCSAEVKVLPGHNHDQIVQTEQAWTTVADWIGRLPS